MRIAFIGQKGFPASWGGIEVHVDAIARRLAARGHEVLVFNRAWYGGKLQCGVNDLTVVNTPSLHFRSTDALSHSLTSTLATLGRSVDVVHYHGLGPSLCSVLARWTGPAVVATIHGYDYRAARWGLGARALLRGGEMAALNVAHRTVVVARHLQEHYRARGYETQYVPNGVDPIRPAMSHEIQHFGLEPKRFLLFSARLEANKGAHLLIDAFLRLKRARPDVGVKLAIAGPLVPGDRYSQTLLASAAPDVIFLGEVQANLKAELLGSALGFVAPSAFEGQPLAVLEAMSARVPIVASDIPGHRELLADGAGLLCNCSHPHGIADALSELIDLAEASRKRITAAAHAVAATHCWDTSTTRIEGIYREAVAAAGSAHR